MPFHGERYHTQPRTGFALCQIRFVCNDSDRAGIHVKSNLDSTYKLDGRTDESISFSDADLVAIKNCLERPTEVLLESIRLPDGRRAIFKPARQAHFTLTSKEESEARSERTLTLGPGETCMVHTSAWNPALGQGRAGLA